MGIEAIKTSTPAPCRTMLKDAFKILMNGTEDEVIDYIEKCRKEFTSLPPEEVGFPRTVSNVEKWKSPSDMYQKGNTHTCSGCYTLFNHYIHKNKLEHKYSAIQNGEKIRFCYLKTPNWMHENVISYIQDLPKELDLHKYVDYDLQFQKAFSRTN